MSIKKSLQTHRISSFFVSVSQAREDKLDPLDSQYRREFITLDNQLLNGEMFLQVNWRLFFTGWQFFEGAFSTIKIIGSG